MLYLKVGAFGLARRTDHRVGKGWRYGGHGDSPSVLYRNLTVLRDAFGPGGSVRLACDRSECGSGLIYTWRRLAMSGELTGMVPPALPSAGPAFAEVQVAEPVVPAAPQPDGGGHGQIGIELPSGVRVTVDAAVDAEALARVLAVLQR